MRSRLLAMAAIAGLAAAATSGADVTPQQRPPKTGYQPGDFRWRNVKRSYSRRLASRLAKKGHVKRTSE